MEQNALKARRRATYIALSRQEHLALEQMAVQESRKLNEMMRELIRAEAKKRGIWPSVLESESK